MSHCAIYFCLALLEKIQAGQQQTADQLKLARQLMSTNSWQQFLSHTRKPSKVFCFLAKDPHFLITPFMSRHNHKTPVQSALCSVCPKKYWPQAQLFRRYLWWLTVSGLGVGKAISFTLQKKAKGEWEAFEVRALLFAEKLLLPRGVENSCLFFLCWTEAANWPPGD